MAQLGFYHLTRTTPDAALPELLARTLAAGHRALVRCATPARTLAIDKALWAAEWLPHGTARTGHAEHQPIWITHEPDRPNGARFLFLLDGVDALAEAPDAGWDRVFDLFDGQDEEAVTAARTRWKQAKAAGHDLTYWKQTERGWEKA